MRRLLLIAVVVSGCASEAPPAWYVAPDAGADTGPALCAEPCCGWDCDEWGYCWPVAPRLCGALTDADCQRSGRCESWGACYAHPVHHSCVQEPAR